MTLWAECINVLNVCGYQAAMVKCFRMLGCCHVRCLCLDVGTSSLIFLLPMNTLMMEQQETKLLVHGLLHYAVKVTLLWELQKLLCSIYMASFFQEHCRPNYKLHCKIWPSLSKNKLCQYIPFIVIPENLSASRCVNLVHSFENLSTSRCVNPVHSFENLSTSRCVNPVHSFENLSTSRCVNRSFI